MWTLRSTRRSSSPFVVVPPEDLHQALRVVDRLHDGHQGVEGARRRGADDVRRDDVVVGVDEHTFSGPSAAARKAALTASTLVDETIAVKSVMLPTGTGTRSDVPSRRPFIEASTRLVARAAPVEEARC